MLNIRDANRKMLLTAGALGCDSDRAEILVGLNAAETEFVLEVEHMGTAQLSPMNRERFQTLILRHRFVRVTQPRPSQNKTKVKA